MKRLQPDSSRSQPEKTHVKHVPVRDASGYPAATAPLSAYMISPRYLPREQIRTQAPKRPLGKPAGQQPRRRTPVTAAAPRPRPNRQPVFHAQIATFGTAAPRIRRPRAYVPMDAAGKARQEAQKPSHAQRDGFLAVAAATIAGAVLLFKDSLIQGSQGFIDELRSGTLFGCKRVTYSAASGVAYRRFGIPEDWLRIGLPVVVLALLLAIGILGDLHDGAQNKGGSGGGGVLGGTNHGTTTLQVTPTAAGGHGGAVGSGSHPQTQTNGKTNQTATSGAAGKRATPNGAANSGSSLVFPGVIGGRGSTGSTAPSAGSSGAFTPTGGSSPTISTGSNSVGQAIPTPVGGSSGSGGSVGGSSTPTGGMGGDTTGTSSSSGSSSGAGSGSSGSGSSLLNTTTPLPATVNVPPTNTSLDGKGVESTTPVGVTLN